jgi:hypothetical protein
VVIWGNCHLVGLLELICDPLLKRGLSFFYHSLVDLLGEEFPIGLGFKVLSFCVQFKVNYKCFLEFLGVVEKLMKLGIHRSPRYDGLIDFDLQRSRKSLFQKLLLRDST